jgi:hypothetical protein
MLGGKRKRYTYKKCEYVSTWPFQGREQKTGKIFITGVIKKKY